MRSILLLLSAFACLHLSANAQCGPDFAASVVPYSEACFPSGTDQYTISVWEMNNDTIGIHRLWLEDDTIYARLTCFQDSFHHALSPYGTAFQIEARGGKNGNTIEVEYRIYDQDTTLIDACQGNYIPDTLASGIADAADFQVRISPQPAGDQVRFALDGAAPGLFTLDVLTLDGLLLRSLKALEGPEFVLETASFAPGIYFYRLRGEDAVQASGKLWIR